MITVVKVGGALLEGQDSLDAIWSGIMPLLDHSTVVLVHGAGPQSTALSRRLGHEPRMVHGRRVTTDLDLDVLLWAARGEINARLVAGGLRAGARPVGLCGADAAMVMAERRPPWTIDGETVDFGHVGDIRSVDVSLLTACTDAGFVPVVAPVGTDGRGALFNINADTVATELAIALRADQLLLIADSGGLRSDRHDPDSLITHLDGAALARGISEGWIQDGMRVKVQMARSALERGVGSVRIAAPSGIADAHAGTTITL